MISVTVIPLRIAVVSSMLFLSGCTWRTCYPPLRPYDGHYPAKHARWSEEERRIISLAQQESDGRPELYELEREGGLYHVHCLEVGGYSWGRPILYPGGRHTVVVHPVRGVEDVLTR